MDIKEKKTVWIDLFCFSSFIALRRLARKKEIGEAFYTNASATFLWCWPVLRTLLKVPVKQVVDFKDAQERIDGVSVHQLIQQSLFDVMDDWLKSEGPVTLNARFCAAHHLNKDKLEAHLKEFAYPFLYRALQLKFISQKMVGEENGYFLLLKTPFIGVLRDCLGRGSTHFYRGFLNLPFLVKNRPDYFYDKFIHRRYFSGRMAIVSEIWLKWISHSLLACVTFPFTNKKARQENMIGIELTQPRIRLDEINDLYWLNDRFDTSKVLGLEMRNMDQASMDILEQKGIRRVKIIQNPYQFAKYCLKNRRVRPAASFVFAGIDYIKRSSKPIAKTLVYLFQSDANGWIRFHQAQYLCLLMFWQSVYRQLGVKILWSMIYVDKDKLVKSQAVETQGGFYAGSHWSNLPVPMVESQHCYDVLFTWGKHFVENIFIHYPHEAIFVVGYPSDHYFRKRRERSIAIRAQYEGKFILTYLDNTFANDLEYTLDSQVKVYDMLVEALEVHDQLIVFLKPKRFLTHDAALKRAPKAARLIEQGRIRVFLGEEANVKYVPAEIGQASDLIIGLGFSTAACECSFAGANAIHADFTYFTSNAFTRDAVGRLAFRDKVSLKAAVCEHIEGKNALTQDEQRMITSRLDPFQDGLAYQRTAFIVSKLHALLSQGTPRLEALEQLKQDYEAYRSESKTEELVRVN